MHSVDIGLSLDYVNEIDVPVHEYEYTETSRLFFFQLVHMNMQDHKHYVESEKVDDNGLNNF